MRTKVQQCSPDRGTWQAGLLVALVLMGARPTADAQTAPTSHTVRIEAMQFSPASLEVKAGDTIKWINSDPFAHEVIADNKAFHSGAIQAGKSWTFKAAAKGVFPYFCGLHPGMKASIVVR
jgi:plastocyanin